MDKITLYALIVMIASSISYSTYITADSIDEPAEINSGGSSKIDVVELLDDESQQNLTKSIELKWRLSNELIQRSNISEEMKTALLSQSNSLVNYTDVRWNRIQFQVISDGMDKLITFLSSQVRTTRMAAPDFGKIPAKRWTKMPIKYVTLGVNDIDLKDNIEKALDQLNQNSDGCVSFVRVSKAPNGSHLYFKEYSRPGFCASSPVGRHDKGNTILISPQCKGVGTIMHEVLHSLGFGHTQSRPDRDQYVKVDFDNILENYEQNFDIMNDTLIDQLPYDCDSIMHYHPYAFANDTNKCTITPIINASHNFGRMGQRNGLSQQDVKTLRKIYCGQRKSIAPSCSDSIKTCVSFKQEVCVLNSRSLPEISIVKACSSTCRRCDRLKQLAPLIGRTCRDFINYRCRRMAQRGDCNSSDIRQRVVAHVTCPRACNVCVSDDTHDARPAHDDLSCKDNIRTCKHMDQSMCSMHDGSTLFRAVKEQCRKTCRFCHEHKPQNPLPLCDNFDVNCYEMYQTGDCKSKNSSTRMRAHLLCPRLCQVCMETPTEDPSCKDGISTCSSISESVCGIERGTPFFGLALNSCMRTCNMCNAGFSFRNYTCNDVDPSSSAPIKRDMCARYGASGRLVAHLMWPKTCGVCANQSILSKSL